MSSMALPGLPDVPAVLAWPGPELKVVLCAVSDVPDAAVMSFSGCDLRRLEPM